MMVGQTYALPSKAIDKARRIELWDRESGGLDVREQRKKIMIDVPQSNQRGHQM